MQLFGQVLHPGSHWADMEASVLGPSRQAQIRHLPRKKRKQQAELSAGTEPSQLQRFP